MPGPSSRISVEEAAQRLGLSPDEVIRLRRSGKIRGYPDYGDWVFEEADVAELAAEMGIAPLETAGETPAPETDPTPLADADQPDAAPPPPKRPAETSIEAVSLEELAGSQQPVSSARLIASLAARHETEFHQAAAVVDGFWDHLLDPRHYRRGKGSLVMPHFGTFSLKRTNEGQTELRFKSRPLTQLRERRASSGTQRPSTNWIDHWQQHPPSQQRLNALSLKRRLTVAIADDTGLDLPTTFLILWDLVETITGIMTGSGTEIRWAKRGVMKATSDHFSFRTYKRLADTLPSLPAPRRSRRQSSSSHRSHRRRSQSGCATTLLKVMFYVVLSAIVIFMNAASPG